MELYADIIVDITHEKLDRTFQYRIPEALQEEIRVGSMVVVPFGASNKEITGYCIGVTALPSYDKTKIKEIISLKEKGVTAQGKLIQLADFMKNRYGVTMIQALKTVLPVKQTVEGRENRTVSALLSQAELSALRDRLEKKHQSARVRLVTALLEKPELSYEYVTKNLKISTATLKWLQEEGVGTVESVSLFHNPVQGISEEKTSFTLSRDQQYIIEEISEHRQKSGPGKYLIHGITGSGKTAVYVELIERILARGEQAIVLIPEISLTYQTLRRFYTRFGSKVSVMNSTLSQGEKYDQMKRAQNGDIQVIIGPRSALFTPFEKIGLIVIDEEHESSYKSDLSPRYHAREVAAELARLHGADLVLGSATPSMEAYYAAQQGEYRLFELKERLTGGSLPTTQIVDLRAELREGNRSIFSRLLQDRISDRLQKKEQTLLFLNRRGYTSFVSCRSCGHVLTCPHCSVSLSLHRDGLLHCHYCGYTQPQVLKCPKCGSAHVLGFKAGTQQVEEKVKELFPQARVLRMDGDTTRHKNSHQAILSAFERQEADILVGTQRIVTGHAFPNVTLVGIIAADLSLSEHDFRSGERTFQLLTQAAGRAGRGVKPGDVIIQTYQPQHYSVQAAAAQDYKSFYTQEMAYRSLLHYPPASSMMAIQICGREEKGTAELAQGITAQAQKAVSKGLRVQLLGPGEAGVYKLKDIYRHILYVKAAERHELLTLKNILEQYKAQTRPANEKEYIQFDFL
ncbi:MAG: primosomal protein N' [Lachnospiraceae bacterium]|nr:primosomal protein N' [Lachnospiraceae bacterium]